ncbi:GFA family protein [Seongchinamella unica]|uniref:GFA family protein n=1 Tax=Seongchinamella unica TaxID=2547392 RepID=A0A4R5LRL1_9GAMM|nr:GFA family protein [Seongchinamella unica]TDG13436.1 GFA family protein [Seongchinamella unica]
MKQQAKCLCGKVSITVSGKPELSIVCNCTNCQRRTGSPFAAILYFPDNQVVAQSGETKSYQFRVESGNTNTTFFCPDCGSTVFFRVDLFQGQTGIAAGCFNDPDIPMPAASAWTKSKYRWVQFPEDLLLLEKQVPSHTSV